VYSQSGPHDGGRFFHIGTLSISARDRIRAAVDVRGGEGLPLFLLVAQAWCMGISNTFLDASATALFLTHFAIDRLPWVYIASAVTGASFGFLIARLEARITPARLLAGTMAMLVVSVSLMYAGVVRTDAPWLSIVLMMWKDVQYILSAMCLWAAAGILFNLRQGKRLFGLVGTGDIAAIIGGGLAIPLVARALGAPHLLGVAAAAQLGCLLTFGVTVYRFGSRFADSGAADTTRDGASASARSGGGLWSMLRDPYLRPLFAVSVLSYLGYYFVDYGFYARVQATYPSAEQVASFYGFFLAATGAVNLLSNLFLSGRILTRYGVRVALMVLPVLVGVGAGLSLASIAFGLTALLAWSVIATKLVDEVFRKSIESPTYRVLYQPLRARDRLRVQAIRESVVEPLAIGLSGAILLLLTRVLQVPATSLVWGVAGIVALWIVFATKLGAGYTAVLRAAIGRRKLTNADVGLDDATTMRLVREFLESADGAEMVYALKVLESTRAPDVNARLVAALEHPDALVREHAIAGCERRAITAAAGALERRMAVEPVVALRGRAVRAYCAVSEAEALDLVTPLLADPEQEIRRGAMAGLLRHCGIDGVLAGGVALRALLDSTSAADRLLAAQVLGDARIPGFYRPLLQLLTDDDVAVCRAAMVAAGALADGRLAPFLLVQLENPARRQAAAAALTSIGDDAVPVLATVLVEPGASRPVRRQAARILGRIGTKRSLQTLVDALETTDVGQRGTIIAALERARWRAGGDQRARVTAVLRREAADLATLYAALAECLDDDLATFRGAVAAEITPGRARVLSLLTLLIPDQTIRDAAGAMSSESAERRAQALEMIETLLPRPLRKTIIPLLDDLAPADRVRRLGPLLGEAPATPWERVAEIARGSGEDGRVWLRAVALRAAGLRRASGLDVAFEKARTDRELLIRETAGWAGRLVGSAPGTDTATGR
jgi:AAA family ATP:ADP antiporter